MKQDREQSSSVVIRGLDATTFEQMEDFVDDLQQRPLDRLMQDLPRLARLSSTKFALVSYVMKRKFEAAAPVERERMRETISAATTGVEDDARERLVRLLERLA